jgi:hypothetical protein
MILDYIDRLELTEEEARAHGNEMSALNDLRQGLEYLNRQVLKVEKEVNARTGPAVRCCLYGNVDDLLHGIPMGLVACSFHWYAVSACNYVRLVGWLRCANARGALDYLGVVLPEVRSWRDKVAAHYALACSDPRDSEAERKASVLMPIGWNDDAFWASPIVLHIRSSGKVSDSSALRPWSLTKVHEKLRQRYWPVEGQKEAK